MIPDEFVTFETAELLRNTGFPQWNVATYDKDGKILFRENGMVGIIAAPTQAQAMRWLREAKHLAVVIDYTWYNGWEYELLIDYDTEKSKLVSSVGTTTYESAAEAGIQAACKCLIERGIKINKQ